MVQTDSCDGCQNKVLDGEHVVDCQPPGSGGSKSTVWWCRHPSQVQSLS